jgi:methylated-DNA-[protein]-cysteine S-methyltransferase
MKKKAKENLFYAASKIAGLNFKVFASAKGIRRIFINKNEGIIKKANLTKLQPDDPYLFNIFTQLNEYFKGERKKINVPLDLNGTEFQKKVWAELNKIPYGKTVSYKKVASKLGNVNSYRAVGKVNGLNPACIIIPCHRVIYSNGKLGSYPAGIKVKEKLLELEGSLSLELFEDY